MKAELNLDNSKNKIDVAINILINLLRFEFEPLGNQKCNYLHETSVAQST